MKVFESYSEGIRKATAQPKMIFILWLINFIFGFFIFYLSYGAICKAIGKSTLAENLVKRFDFNVLFEFLLHEGKSVYMILSVAFLLILAYYLFSVFLYGGILFTLTQPQTLTAVESKKSRFASIFFQGAGKFFCRFFRVCIYSLILWAAFILLDILLKLLGRAFTADGANEQMTFYFFWVRLGIEVFLILLIHMILDYTRIKIVVEDSRYVFRSLFQMAGFVFRKFGRTLGLYYLVLVTGVIVLGIIWLLKWIIPSHTLLFIIVAFVLGQVFIAAQGWLKITFQAAQLTFYSR